MRILYVATVGGFMPFFKTLVKDLIDAGNVVDFAANQSTSKVPDYYKEWGCKVFDISCSRSPFSFGNIKAIREIRELAKNYDIVHCHTPLASMATRFACRKLRKKQNLKVIYTAHGFHFFSGAPFKNWVLYYPIEKICSKYTDLLITINKEDFHFAKEKMNAKQTEYVPGVGVDVNAFADTVIDKEAKRESLGIPASSVVVLSVGELNKNKNQQLVIRAISMTKDKNIHYIVAGEGPEKANLEKTASSLGVNLHLLGHRRDVAELYKVSDVFVHPSFREGLPVAVIEAIASGCTCLCSNIRGCRDLIEEEFLFSPYDETKLSNMIKSCIDGSLSWRSPDVKQLEYKSINRKMIALYEVVHKGQESIK